MCENGSLTEMLQAPPIQLNELLLLCLKKGAAADWEELLRRVQPLIARTASRFASSSGPVRSEDVDDIVQDTCMKLAVTRAKSVARAALESEASAFAYIKMMALNTARDFYGKERRHPVMPECELAAPLDRLAAQAGPGVDWDVLLSQIDSALDTDSRGRSVFWLYFVRGYSMKEISEIPSVGLETKGVESLVKRLADSVQEKFAAGKISGEMSKGKSASESS